MKTENRNILGFNVPIVGIAETLGEAVAAAGSEEAVLKDFNNNVLAHSHFTIVRRVITKSLVELTGIKLLTEKNGDKEVVVESEGEYRDRLEGQLGADVLESYEAAIAEKVSKVTVDYTPGVRGTGEGSKPAKKWLAYFDQLVAEGKLDAFVAKHGIDASLEGDELKFAVANKVKAIVTAKLAEAAKSALA